MLQRADPFDVLRQLSLDAQHEIFRSMTFNDGYSLRRVCRRARDFVDSVTDVMRVCFKEREGATPLHHLLQRAPVRWPSLTALTIILHDLPYGHQVHAYAQRLVATLLEHPTAAQALKELTFEHGSSSDEVDDGVSPSLLVGLAVACPRLEVLHFTERLEFADPTEQEQRLVYQALARMPHLQDLGIADTDGLRHIALMSSCTALTALTLHDSSWLPGHGHRRDVDWAQLRASLAPLAALAHLAELCINNCRSWPPVDAVLTLLRGLHGQAPPLLRLVAVMGRDLGAEAELGAGGVLQSVYVPAACGKALHALGRALSAHPELLPANGLLPLLRVDALQLHTLPELSGEPQEAWEGLSRRCASIRVGTVDASPRAETAPQLLQALLALGSLPEHLHIGLKLRLGSYARRCAVLPGERISAQEAASRAGGSSGAAPAAVPVPTLPGIFDAYVRDARAAPAAALAAAVMQEAAAAAPAADPWWGSGKKSSPEAVRRLLMLSDDLSLPLLADIPGTLEPWVRHHMGNGLEVPRSYVLLRPLPAVALVMGSARAAAAALTHAPGRAVGAPLEVLPVAASPDECVQQALQAYLDAPLEPESGAGSGSTASTTTAADAAGSPTAAACSPAGGSAAAYPRLQHVLHVCAQLAGLPGRAWR